MKQTIQLSLSDLKSALNGLSKVVAKRTTLPVLAYVQVSQRDEQVTLEATDLETTVRFNSAAKGSSSAGSILVPFDDLQRLAKASRGEHLLVCQEKDQTWIDYPVGEQRVQRTLAHFDSKEWPVGPSVEGKLLPLAENFPSTLQAALTCAPTESGRESLCGGWLDVTDPKSHYIFGTDGKHLFSANSFVFDLKESLLIPTHKFLLWPGFVEDGIWQLAVQPKTDKVDGWIKLESAHWSFVTKQRDATCVNWRQVVPAEFKHQVSFNENAVRFLKNLLPTLPGAKDHNSPVTFKFDAGGSVVCGRTDKGLSLGVPIAGITVKGAPIEISLNRNFALKGLNLGFTELNIVDGLTPIVFTSQGRKLTISLMRPEVEPTPTSANVPAEPAPAPEPPQPPTPTESTMNPTEPVKTPPVSVLKQAVTIAESLKESLRTLLGNITNLSKVLTQAQKEQKVAEKEVEDIRTALQSLQKLRL